jgi:hypothetical protein
MSFSTYTLTTYHCQKVNSDFDKTTVSWDWWCTAVIPVFQRLKHKDLESKASLGYIANT